MSRTFSITPVRILGLKDGQPWYDSRDYPVQFYPAGDAVSIIGVNVSFPDFHHSNAYGFVAGDTGGGVIRQACSSYVSIPFQDWGPSDQPGITDVLSDTVIGTIPADIDVTIIRVKGVRTNSPDQILGNSVPVSFEEDFWVGAEGGTMLVELLFPIVRMIWIRFAAIDNGDGTRNIILSRKQSIQKTLYSYWRSGNSPLNTGWTYGGTNGRYGHLAKLIESKGPTIAPGGVITYRRGDGGQCSLTDTSDYSSDFTFDIEILPGRSFILEESAGGASGLGATRLTYTDSDNVNVQATSHTFNGKYIGSVPEDEDTRTVYVVATATIQLQSAAESLNSITYNGVAMTQIARQTTYLNATGSNDPTTVTGIWAINAPASDGDTANIVLNYSASFWWSQIDVYAGYNVDSPLTPIETLQSGTGSITHSLDTEPYGITIGALVNVGGSGGTFTLTGPENITSEQFTITTPNLRDGTRVRAYEENDAATLSIAITDTHTGSTSTSANAWASFQGVPGKTFEFSDTDFLDATSNVHAYTNKIIGDVPAANNKRYVVVVLGCVSAAGADMGTVTLNGSTMTLLRKQRSLASGTATITAVYGLELPTGADADFVFNFTANVSNSFIDVYTLYNLNSLTPVDQESTSGFVSSYSGSINTGRYGFGIALGMVHSTAPSVPPTLTAFENTSPAFVGNSNATFIRSSGVTAAGSSVIGMTASANLTNFMWMTFN